MNPPGMGEPPLLPPNAPGIETVFSLVPSWQWKPQNCQVLMKAFSSGPFTMYIHFVGGKKPGEDRGNTA